jgi:L-ascorbate metabolism protein UlaG (beta-lactamase superfamily)
MVDSTTGSLTFVGTATTVIRFGDITLLTDPNFLHRGQRAYFGYGLTGKRQTEPALSVAQLPPLDAIVLSHLHGDHWDRVAQRQLDHNLPVITTAHAAKRLQWRGFSRALGVRTWTQHTLVQGSTSVRITALPARHAPGPARRLLPPVMGSMLEFGTVGGADVRLRMYITGDTILVEELREIANRYPAVDVGVWHLGGTRLPGGLLVTMDGAQGADLLDMVRPDQVIPIHLDDYRLFTSPLSDFRSEVERRGLSERVTYVQPGETVRIGPARRP